MERAFDCLRDCVRNGNIKDGERAARGCTHPLWDPVEWDVAPEKLTFYMGAPERFDDRGKSPPPGMNGVPDWWLHPPEPLEDGCPAGWGMSPFAQSIYQYVRRRTKEGGRVSNPRFDALTDRVAQDAVLLYEDEQERVLGYQEKLSYERLKAQTSG